MDKLRFGVGGIPLTAKNGVNGGVRRLRELGLDHMELEFVQSVFLTPEKALELKATAEENDVSLSVHGSYYVNLATDDRPKWHASISRVVQAANIGNIAGAHSVTYHSGFFQKKSFADVKPIVVDGMREIFNELEKKEATNIRISPELTGKAAQVGDLPELIEIVQQLQSEGFTKSALCIDFAHQYARHGGKFNTYDEFMDTIEKVATGLGEQFIKDLHMHVSAIAYGPKGESHHLTFYQTLDEYKANGIVVEGIETHWAEQKEARFIKNEFNWQDLLKALKASGVHGFVVCESPLLELDAIVMQKYYEGL